MKIARLAAVLGIAVASAYTARADDQLPSFSASKTSTVTSTVKSVDQKTRMVTLVNQDGEVTFKADKRVKNLKQVHPGDTLTATVTESLSARVLKPGEAIPLAAEGSTTASAPLGAKPAGYTATEVLVVATISAIDKNKMVVTLTGPKGNSFPVQVKNKDNLNKIKIGDNVEIHATETMAIAVTAPKKK